MKKLLKFLDEHGEETMLILLECAIVLVMLYQIIRRYVFNSSLSWSEEFCRYCFIWFMFIGYSYSIRERIDLRMDAIVNLLPVKVRRLVNRIGLIICFALTVLVFVNSFGVLNMVINTGEKSTSMQLPMSVVYVSMTIGFGLAIVRYIQRFIEEFKSGKEEEK